MALIAVEAVPADSRPPAADDSLCTPPRVEDAALALRVDQGVTDAFFRSQRGFGYFSEAGQTRRAVIGSRRRAISVYHSICCRVALRALASLGAWFYV